jgi:diguanylate cyclase (GGDEF)-like protein
LSDDVQKTGGGKAGGMGKAALVVEDDPAIRALIVITLEQQGYDVTEAGDGLSALAAARANTPDVILLDIGLPDIDGLAVLKRLKDDVLLRKVPALMVTAWSEPDMIRLAMERGACDYVSKPFNVNDLAVRVDAAYASGREPAAARPAPDAGAGLPALAHLETVVERQAMATRRTGRPFAVVRVALGFDAPGIADDVVRAAAKRLRMNTAVNDVITRIGEHELGMVFPGCDGMTAVARAETLLGALTGAPLDTPTAVVEVTGTFGVAAFEVTEHHLETLTRAADAAREAVAAGGARVRMAGRYVTV